MSIARAIWSQTFTPGQTELQRVDADIKLSLVVLDEKLVNQERCSIRIIQRDPDDEESTTFVLANLIPGKIEAQVVDLVISAFEDIEISVTGKNTVHLSGNYITQPDDDESDMEDDFDDEDMGEDSFALHEVSSDVEIDPADMMDEDSEEDEGRFEEIEEAKAKPVAAKAVAAEKTKADKKQKKNKEGGEKPATKAAPQAAAKPAGGAPKEEGKKNKKNKNKNKDKAA
ncbi:hypothetical protein DL93DRAFT_1744475 [Clavulina sp. PMI_390]|nr:hypothetical protein DL93DRAFT_1744475 [Clavulina sp. PMI_390]